MQSHKNLLRLALTAMLFLLGACSSSGEVLTPTIDATLIYTQAAQTVAAQFTQTSAALTSAAPSLTATVTITLAPSGTFTPVVTAPVFTPPVAGTQSAFFTPTLALLPSQATPTGVLCNNSIWVADIGVQDGAVLKPSQSFAKGWLVQNTGFCDWGVGYTLVQTGGNTNFSATPFAIRYPRDTVPAGAIAEISLNMTAPKQPGLYEAHYQMFSNLSVPFGTGLSISIEVKK